MSCLVKVAKGFYRGENVEGTFSIVQPWKTSKGGAFVTVTSTKELQAMGAGDTARIKVEQKNFSYVTEEGKTLEDYEYEAAVAVEEDGVFVIPGETDDEAKERIRKNFATLEQVTSAALSGIVSSVVISGPAGCGKSYEVEAALEEVKVLNRLKNDGVDGFRIIRGMITPPALYAALFEASEIAQKYCHGKYVTVFDDCDMVLEDDICLNMFKSILEIGNRPRKLSWLSSRDSVKVRFPESLIDECRSGELPSSFEFVGSVMFLTNLNFRAVRGRMRPHLDAIMSRSLYLDLELTSTRDSLLRIMQVVDDGLLEQERYKDLTKKQKKEVVAYVTENAEGLNDLSIRTIEKTAGIRMMPRGKGENWLDFADMTLLRPAARIKRIMAEREAKEKEGA